LDGFLELSGIQVGEDAPGVTWEVWPGGNFVCSGLALWRAVDGCRGRSVRGRGGGRRGCWCVHWRRFELDGQFGDDSGDRCKVAVFCFELLRGVASYLGGLQCGPRLFLAGGPSASLAGYPVEHDVGLELEFDDCGDEGAIFS
jgi:hypothetical protein